MKIPFISGYLIYVLTGYCLHNYDLKKKYRILIYLFGLVGWLLHFFGTSILSNGQQEIVMTFKGYENLPCYMHSVAVFTFFKYFKIDIIINNKLEFFIYRISSLTFGVYLIHKYLLTIIANMLLVNTASILWRTLGGFFVFILSMFIVDVLKKIPIINNFLP